MVFSRSKLAEFRPYLVLMLAVVLATPVIMRGCGWHKLYRSRIIPNGFTCRLCGIKCDSQPKVAVAFSVVNMSKEKQTDSIRGNV